jgi:hypothetical protein
MVDLSKYGQTEFEGTITAVYVQPLRMWLKTKAHPLDDKVIDEKFANPDRDNIIVVAECNGKPIDAFYMVPSFTGYSKSNLKRFIERNSLPLVDIPKEVKKWLGKKVKIVLDKDGYMRLAV